MVTIIICKIYMFITFYKFYATVTATIICDFILLGRPISAQEFLKFGTESMNYVSEWRITFGTFFGVVVLPFQIAGIITVYFGLKRENSVIPFIVSLLLTHALIMGVAFTLPMHS